ncbi:MAG: right-handed parallel beta-helix repeat-containing protein [bacterium]|nr:right-handed parallel beta-helix repeat-containing protein [bacterium]
MRWSYTHPSIAPGQPAWSGSALAGDGRLYVTSFDGKLYRLGDPTPVAIWHFDEGAGGYAYDSSGNDHTGTLHNGPEWTVGISGHAVRFDGVDDYVDIGRALDGLTDQFTISAWVKPSKCAIDLNIVGSVSNGEDRRISLRSNCFTIQPAGQGFVEACFPPLGAGEWAHLVGVYDGAGITVYKNGIPLATTAASGSLAAGSTSNRIGSKGSTWHFSGLIDEVCVYDQPLSASAIAKIYDSDDDGLPDIWERHHFGDLSQGAGDDYDGDGLTNFEEYINGTDPADPYTPGANKVAILIRHADFHALREHVDTYVADVEARFGATLLRLVRPWNTPEEIKEALVVLYEHQQITGAVLVGDLPIPLWYYSSFPGTNPFYLFYEDLDGVFTRCTQPGHEDEYCTWEPGEGNTLEIWVTSIRPQGSDPDPIATIRHFLDKTHRYYTGKAVYPRRGLIHCHCTYPGAANPGSLFHSAFSNLYGDAFFVEGGAFKCPYPSLDYLHRLQEGFEIVSAPWCHGTSFSAGDVGAVDVQGIVPPRSLINIGWSCNDANFHNQPDNLGIGYVMGNSETWVDGQPTGEPAYSDGQAYIGVTRIIGSEDHHMVISELGDGKYAGEAYKEWKNYMYTERRLYFNGTYNPWGFVFIGNPFLDLPDIKISRADPHFVYIGYSDATMIITGTGFDPACGVRLNNIEDPGTEYLCEILSAIEYRVEVRLPDDLPPGVYHVTLVNPDGRGASFVEHFYVIGHGDSDGDGLSDYDEVEIYFTNPYKADTDGDGISDGDEVSGILNWRFGYGPTNPNDPNSDDDNLASDYDEIMGNHHQSGSVIYTDPNDWDTDNDRLCDGCEKDPRTPAVYPPYDPDMDTDADGLTDKEEIRVYKTSVICRDTDGDVLDDGEERDYWVSRGIDPMGDIDRDKQPNILDRDSDNDGIPDGVEVKLLGTDPANWDTDGDGMPDGWEVYYGLDPLRDDANEDANGDGVTNLEHYLAGTEPAPPPPASVPGVYYVDGQDGFDALDGKYSQLVGVGGPWKTISHAVSNARPGDTIWVRAGTYPESPGSSMTHNGSSGNEIVLKGDWAGEIWPDSTSRPIVDGEYVRNEGLYIRRQYWIVKNFEARNALHNGFEIGSGGAGSYSTISNCVARDNRRAGVNVHYNNQGVVIEESVAHGNAGNGFSIYPYQLTGEPNIIRRSTAHGNSGHGIYVESNTHPEDTAQRGNIRVESSLSYGNKGRGLYGSWATLTMVNTTIADNKQSGFQVILGEGGVTTAIYNSIIVDNTGYGITIASGVSHDTDWNCLSGNTIGDWGGVAVPGPNSITDHPVFIDAAGGDYRLRDATSSCYEAGNAAWAPATDLAGVPFGDPPNMGAYAGAAFCNMPLFVHRPLGMWIEQTRAATANGLLYSFWSDEYAGVTDNGNVFVENGEMYPAHYSDRNASLYIGWGDFVSEAGDRIRLTYQAEAGGGALESWIYLPSAAALAAHTDIHGFSTIHIGADGASYWDELLCDPAQCAPPPTATPTPTATPASTPSPAPTGTPTVDPTPMPPSAPDSITYPSSSATGIYEVFWAPSDGALTYELERSHDAQQSWNPISSGMGTSYSQEVGNGSYWYRVKATNGGGTSAWRTGTHACVVDAPAPTPHPDHWYQCYGPAGRDEVVQIGDMYVTRHVQSPGAPHWLVRYDWDTAIEWAKGNVRTWNDGTKDHLLGSRREIGNWLGRDDWRLPTAEEMGLMYQNRHLLGYYYYDKPEYSYWTSTADEGGNARAYSWYNLGPGEVARPRTETQLVRAVRDVPLPLPDHVPADGFPEGFKNAWPDEPGTWPAGWDYENFQSGDAYLGLRLRPGYPLLSGSISGPPMLRFERPEQAAITREFSNPTALYFWAKLVSPGGNGPQSKLIIKQLIGTTWFTLAEIQSLPVKGVLMGPYYPDYNATRILFKYEKAPSGGNLALDDVMVFVAP